MPRAHMILSPVLAAWFIRARSCSRDARHALSPCSILSTLRPPQVPDLRWPHNPTLAAALSWNRLPARIYFLTMGRLLWPVWAMIARSLTHPVMMLLANSSSLHFLLQ